MPRRAYHRHTRPSLPPERWREVLAAADRALALDLEERQAFVAQCSADDPPLGAELKALLASADSGSALDSPAAVFAGPLLADLSAEPDPVGSQSRIGPYRVVGEIGRGGMGAVYLAERADDQYRKQVALKLLSAGSASDEHRVRRFLEERQILAALEHPDIARLLDGGVTLDGLPWFAMEYVEGEPIDQYCDARNLSIERRLELFHRVCAAVQYAHRHLIVHRDLKPANILGSGDGEVKLLDFGIAKLLGVDAANASGVLTQTGERVMTPLYASPEQVRGDSVSTASDVYALGVLLYELLAGRHPYRHPTRQPHEVALAILEQELERPSAAVLRPGSAPESGPPGVTPEQIAAARGSTPVKLARRLHGDLEAIVLKAMDKDPKRRYGSAEQLEADIQRHLTGLPVVARPASRLYQTRKFLRRHRVGASATAGVTLLVLGFAIVTEVQSLRVAAERDRAEAVLTHLQNVFGTSVSSPGEDRGVTAREVLDSSAARIERDLSADPEMRARLLFDMGRAYHELGIGGRARQLLEASVALQRRSSDDRRALASTLLALGGILLEQGEVESAERNYEEALALRRKLLGPRHSDVARTLNGLAAVRLAQGRFPEAEALSRNALAIDRRQPGDHGVDVAQSLRGVARARLATGDYDEAARLYAEALSLLRERLPEEHLDIAGTVLDLAAALRGKGENRAADSLLRYGVALQRRAAATVTLTVGVDSMWLRALGAPQRSLGPNRSFGSKIVFLTDRHRPDAVGHLGHQEIYVMNPDGSGQRRLTYSEGRVAGPAISPDGTRIAYHNGPAEVSDIFIIDVTGGEPVRVTNMAATGLGAAAPTWSPDGKRLAFTGRPRLDIYVINVDGTGLRNLTNHPAIDRQPDWSPDGRRIAFVSDRGGSPAIYVMNADGTDPVRLTLSPASKAGAESTAYADEFPDWSPDGQKIAFTSDRDGNREIYVINADGTGLARLTVDPTVDANPSWSPDGRQIAFHRRVLGHAQIFVMNADGSAPRQLTEASPVSASYSPNWGPASPMRFEAGAAPAPSTELRALRAPQPIPGSGRSFGSKIVFLTDRHRPDPVGHLGHTEIYVMNPDGSGQRRLTHSDGRITNPSISPDGRRIAFNTQPAAASDIFIMDAGGGEWVRVTNMARMRFGAVAPTWSPDGMRLAFHSSSPRQDIHLINVDGTGLTTLTNDPARDRLPDWSPDGGRIAFESDRDGSPDIYVINADGTETVRLTFNAALKPTLDWSLAPDWSPDGRKIAFASDRDGNHEIYVVNADGTGLARLTVDPATDQAPSWSPDGREIAFHRRVFSHAQIFVMNADGSSPRPLTEPSPVLFNGLPSWGPAPPARRAATHQPKR